MVMFEQSRRLSEPLRWGRREKTALAVVLSALAICLVALGIYAATTGAPARADCVTVTFASTLGGAEMHACGAKAKLLCASGAHRPIAPQLSVACRKAGFPFGAG
jgi:hypothetical protein